MYKVIMVPTEGSEIEEPAIALGVRLAQRFNAELRLVRVDIPQLVLEPMTSAAGFAESQKVLAEAHLARLRRLEALGTQCRVLGEIRVITALEDGPAAVTLREYAEKFHVDLIVMGSHCRGGLSRLTLGSVTDYLVRHTDIPVLVVKRQPSLLSAPGDGFRKIVVPLDGSPMAEQILPHVATLAAKLDATVSVIQVLVPSTYAQKQMLEPLTPWWEADMAAASEYLDGAAAYLASKGLEVTKDVVLSENVTDAILDYGFRSHADLIAVGTSGAGGLGRLVFGSVPDEVTRKAKMSVLVFHPRMDSPVEIDTRSALEAQISAV